MVLNPWVRFAIRGSILRQAKTHDTVTFHAMPTNLFDNLPASVDKELTEVLASSENVRIERIVSTGQASPDDFWYDQSEHEWVIVLAGEAMLRFKDTEATLQMKPGDHVTISAGRKHRVESTSSTEPTVWLAVFYR